MATKRLTQQKNWDMIGFKSILFLIITSLFFNSAAITASPASQSDKNVEKVETLAKKGDISKGKKIYNKYCYYCHGIGGHGDGAIAIGVTPHPANFVKDTERMKKSDEELFQSIANGIRREVGGDEMAMPQWNLILTEDEIWSVLAYVRYLSQKGQEEDAKNH